MVYGELMKSDNEGAERAEKAPKVKERLEKGISLRAALMRANALSIAVVHVRRTGELRFTAPGHHPVLANARRKDVSRAVAKLLRDVAAEQKRGAE